MKIEASFSGTWQLRQGADYSDEAASKAAAEIEKLKTKLGRTPEASDLLKVARSQRSYLHAYFDWSDDAAAAKWRYHQATLLLGAIKVKVVMGDTVVRTSLYPSVRIADGTASERQRVCVHNMLPGEDELLMKQAAADLRVYTNRHAAVLSQLGLQDQALALIEAIERALQASKSRPVTPRSAKRRTAKLRPATRRPSRPGDDLPAPL